MTTSPDSPVSPDASLVRPPKPAMEWEAWSHKLAGYGVPPRYRYATWDSRLVLLREEGKADAVKAAQTMVHEGYILSRDMKRPSLLLSGPYGVGKTHLASSAFGVLAYMRGGGMWRKWKDFVREVQGAYRAGDTNAVMRAFEHTPVLLVDDVGDVEAAGPTSDDKRRILFEVVDSRSDRYLPTLLTTNLTNAGMAEQFGERTFQRLLEMCALIRMDGVNFRENPPPGLIYKVK